MPGIRKDGKIDSLINPDLMPPYSGLIIVLREQREGYSGIRNIDNVKEMKRAPLLHKEKVTIKQVMKISNVLSWRMWDLREKITLMKQEREKR